MATAISSEYAELDRANGRKPTRITANERRVVEYVKKQVAVSDAHKEPFVRDAYLALAAWLNLDRVRFDPIERRLVETEEAEDVDWTPPVNYVAAVVDTLVARSTESTPNPEVAPGSSDEDDVLRARFSNSYLRWRMDELNLEGVYHDFVQGAVLAGLGVLKIGWDPNGGREVTLRDQPSGDDGLYGLDGIDGLMSPDDADDANGDVQTAPAAKVMSGCPRLDNVTLFEFGWDPGCGGRFDRARWAFHDVVLHIDEVRQRWPETSFNLKPDVYRVADGWRQQAQMALRGSQAISDGLQDYIRVHEYYEVPGPRHPNGFYACVAGDRVLSMAEYLPYGRLPFCVARYQKVAGRLVGKGAVPNIIGVQYDLHQADRDFRANLKQVGNTAYFAEEGAVVGGEIAANPGAVIEVVPGRPYPIPKAPPPPSPAHLERARIAEARIWELSGVSDISRGRVPSGLSGRAVGMIADLEASVMGPMIREFARAVRDVSWRILWMTREYMKAPELIRVVGDGLAAEAIEFAGSDIPKTFDVQINVAAMLPRHMSWRREQVVMFFERGLLGNPQEPTSQRRARKLLEFGEMDALYGDNTRARQIARQDNSRLSSGEWVAPRPWLPVDDLEAMAEERVAYMLRSEYRQFDQQTQTRFEVNLAWLQYFISQQLQGVPWWHHIDREAVKASTGLDLPEEPMPQMQDPMQGQVPGMQGPMQGQAPGMAGLDAFGLPPEGAPPPQAAAPIDDGGMASQAFTAAVDQVRAMRPPGVQGLPESNAQVHGPGVGAFEGM